MKKTLIVQLQKPPSIRWINLTTFAENLDEAKEELEEYKGWNQDCALRIIERTTTVSDEIVFNPP